MTDTQLEQLRDELYAFSDVVTEVYCAQKIANQLKLKETETCLAAIPQEERQAVEERAAILEYEGNLKKPEAERLAFGEWVQSKKVNSQPRKKPQKKRQHKPKHL